MEGDRLMEKEKWLVVISTWKTSEVRVKFMEYNKFS